MQRKSVTEASAPYLVIEWKSHYSPGQKENAEEEKNPVLTTWDAFSQFARSSSMVVTLFLFFFLSCCCADSWSPLPSPTTQPPVGNRKSGSKTHTLCVCVAWHRMAWHWNFVCTTALHNMRGNVYDDGIVPITSAHTHTHNHPFLARPGCCACFACVVRMCTVDVIPSKHVSHGNIMPPNVLCNVVHCSVWRQQKNTVLYMHSHCVYMFEHGNNTTTTKRRRKKKINKRKIILPWRTHRTGWSQRQDNSKHKKKNYVRYKWQDSPLSNDDDGKGASWRKCWMLDKIRQKKNK